MSDFIVYFLLPGGLQPLRDRLRQRRGELQALHRGGDKEALRLAQETCQYNWFIILTLGAIISNCQV